MENNIIIFGAYGHTGKFIVPRRIMKLTSNKTSTILLKLKNAFLDVKYS